MRNPHPNATAAGGTSSAALILVWALGRAHIAVSAEEGAALAGGLSTLALLIGRARKPKPGPTTVHRRKPH